jgi:hypothetical protein
MIRNAERLAPVDGRRWRELHEFRIARQRRAAIEVAKEVEDLLTEGFAPESIAVLGLESDVLEDAVSRLAGRLAMQGGDFREIELTRFDSTSTAAVATGQHGVQLATIAAYHGLERDAIIIVLTNDGVDRYLRSRGESALRRDLYIAGTRARTTLVVSPKKEMRRVC